LAARYDLNAKTVAKWRKRTSAEDAQMGPRQPHSTVLTMEQEAVIMAFRQRTLLALDDCLYALQSEHPALDPLQPPSLFTETRHQPLARSRR
jgi:hypothetical protein